MSGPAGVMALVLGQTAAGCAAFLWLDHCLWREVKHGYYKVSGIILAFLGIATWASVRASVNVAQGAPTGATYSIGLSLGATALTLVAVILLFARSDKAARVAGIASVPVWVGLLGAMAAAADGSYPAALFRVVACAAFAGSVTDGMLLGHWYLTDRNLTRGPINRATLYSLVSVATMTVAVVLAGFAPTPAGTTFNPILTSAGLANWIALGMVATVGLIGFLIRAVLKGERSSAVQSATGFYYLGVVCAFVAVTATMVSFLPGA